MEELNRRFICCLCGKEESGWGNSPSPVSDADARCCDMCNMTLVIPARMLIVSYANRRRKDVQDRNM